MEEIKETSIQEVKHGKEIIIDYLTVTFEFRSFSESTELEVVDDYVENVRTLLGISEEQVLEKGFGKGNYRYAYQLADGGMLKLCGPLNERGIHTCSLELKGTGCREFERNRPDITWYDLLLTLFGMYEARNSRLDLTIDDFEGKDCPFVWMFIEKKKICRRQPTKASHSNYK